MPFPRLVRARRRAVAACQGHVENAQHSISIDKIVTIAIALEVCMDEPFAGLG